jgi:hypothetical protein
MQPATPAWRQETLSGWQTAPGESTTGPV